MIAVLKSGTTPQQTQHLVDWLKHMNLDVHISKGDEVTVLGLIGDTSRVDMDLLSSLDIVETVKRVSEPFKQANRKFHPNDTIVEAGTARIGGGYFAMPVPAPWKTRTRSSRWPPLSRPPVLPFSGAALSSPAPPPTPFRA